MSVSVVIPTRDRAELLPRALHSVLAQTRLAEQILVVDDGSQDGTARRVARDFPGVELLRQAPAGVSAARNRGIGASRGRWVAFLDSDDEWLPAKLERQLAALEADGDARICHCDEIWMRRGVRVNPRRKHRKAGGDLFAQSLELCAISPSAAMVERRLLLETAGFDEALPACEDYDLWLRLTPDHRVLLVDEALVVKHGGREDQLSRSVWGLDRFRVRALEKLLAGEGLSRRQRRAARRVLRRRLEILHQGAVKRGKTEAAARYAEKLLAVPR